MPHDSHDFEIRLKKLERIWLYEASLTITLVVLALLAGAILGWRAHTLSVVSTTLREEIQRNCNLPVRPPARPVPVIPRWTFGDGGRSARGGSSP